MVFLLRLLKFAARTMVLSAMAVPLIINASELASWKTLQNLLPTGHSLLGHGIGVARNIPSTAGGVVGYGLGIADIAEKTATPDAGYWQQKVKEPEYQHAMTIGEALMLVGAPVTYGMRTFLHSWLRDTGVQLRETKRDLAGITKINPEIQQLTEVTSDLQALATGCDQEINSITSWASAEQSNLEQQYPRMHEKFDYLQSGETSPLWSTIGRTIRTLSLQPVSDALKTVYAQSRSQRGRDELEIIGEAQNKMIQECTTYKDSCLTLIFECELKLEELRAIEQSCFDVRASRKRELQEHQSFLLRKQRFLEAVDYSLMAYMVYKVYNGAWKENAGICAVTGLTVGVIYGLKATEAIKKGAKEVFQEGFSKTKQEAVQTIDTIGNHVMRKLEQVINPRGSWKYAFGRFVPHLAVNGLLNPLTGSWLAGHLTTPLVSAGLESLRVWWQ
jgi:hypothetical protein